MYFFKKSIWPLGQKISIEHKEDLIFFPAAAGN